MAYVARHDRDDPRSRNLRNPVDCQFKLSFNHLVDFFLRMEVLVNARAARELVVSECHAGGVEIASTPARQALNYIERASIDEGHRLSWRECGPPKPVCSVETFIARRAPTSSNRN